MNRHYDRVAILTSVIGAIFAAFLVYSFLTFLYVAPKITIPISIAMSVLIFGLTRYYSKPYLNNGGNTEEENSSHKETSQNNLQYDLEKNDNRYLPTILFVTIFGSVIVISSFTPNQEFHIFTNWINIGVLELTQLASSILLCFFIPGFAVVLILTKKSKINPILAVLIAYILSMLITGLVGYISALTFDVAISESKNQFIAIYLFVLVIFLIFYPRYRFSNPIKLQTGRFLHFHLVENRILKYCINFRHELLVFGSLFSLIVISTYYLYGGITIGDQWYHQGRSLLFMSGAFREASIIGAEAFYPPFQSALLAVLTVLSGVPVVNAYASIAFLNIIPVFAFLYFFCTWAPATMRKAGLLACSLFTLSSGFGWIYLLTTRTTSDIFSVQSSLETLRNLGHLDIVSASNFIIATGPDFSTGLIYMALPAGLVLLSIIRTPFQRASTKVAIIGTISILGVISHYEFYIFIIIASLLPIIFRLKRGNSIYIGFFFTFFVVYLIDIIAPGSYLSSLKIRGFPLLLLAVSFVSITWIIYLGYRRFRMTLESIVSFFSVNKFQVRLRENFHLATLIVALIAFLYLFCFIVLSQLALNTIIDQTTDNNYPWYLYPMKMGIAGLFGLVFILSYFYKKFEKQVFVFGIIMLVSFIAGPYYDEHRFSKYFMIGMIGFASIMIYELLKYKFINNPIIKSVFVAVIITSSSLSVLIFIGYNSLILQTQDFTNTLYRRHFPSDTDLHLYEFLHNKIDINSRYNVITFLKEYDRGEDGLISKIYAFAGLPYDKLHQDPLTLNASTIESLYYHLWYNDARYVIVSKDIFKTPSIVTDPARFVIDHFTTVYENDNYIVLEVPSLVPPALSSNASVALVYDQGMNLKEPRPSNTTLVQYNSNVYNLNSDNNLVSIQKDNQTAHLNLSGSKSDKGISVWTKNLDQAKRANYIETEFIITNENESKANDVRIEWQEDGMRDYYVKLSNDGLELYKKSDTGKGTLLKNSEFDKSNWKWYTLTIKTLPNSIDIYADNVLKIRAPKITANDRDGITKIGLTSFYNDVQFRPVKIGNIRDPEDTFRTSNYAYNYPLTFLALNKFKYDTFSSNDLSIFSKDAIVISDSVLADNDSATNNRYLDYVHDGGTLVILNSNGNFSSMASKDFSLGSNQSDQEAFTHIYYNTNQKASINIPGWINKTNIETLPDVHVIASYRNDKNDTIAPFIVEKKVPTGGKIILINSQGFFNTISKFPKQYFPSLSNISIPLPIDKPVSVPSKNSSLPMQGYVGKMKISGMVTLNSSSLLLDEGINTFPINASRIIIFNNDSNIPITYKDVSIKELKLMGDYHLNISFSGQSELPGLTSYHDYIDMNIPTGSNMSVNLDSKSGGTIDIANQNGLETESVSLHNNSRVEFYELSTNTTFPVLVKEPELSVNGHVSINNAYLAGYLAPRGKLGLGAPVDLQGRLTTNFTFVDNFYQPYHNATKTQYITFLQSLTMDGKLGQGKEDLKLPGDISFKSKEDVPLVKIFSSPINIFFMSALIIMVILLSNYLWKKKKKKKLQP